MNYDVRVNNWEDENEDIELKLCIKTAFFHTYSSMEATYCKDHKLYMLCIDCPIYQK